MKDRFALRRKKKDLLFNMSTNPIIKETRQEITSDYILEIEKLGLKAQWNVIRHFLTTE